MLSFADALLENLAREELDNDLGRSIGAFLLGALFDFILFGALLHQYIMWSTNASSERLFIKIIIGWSGLMSLATTSYAFYFVWRNFVVHFGELRAWLVFGLNLTWYIFLAAFTTVPTQLFYAERAYILLKKRWWVLAIVLPFIFASLGGALAVVVFGTDTSPDNEYSAEYAFWVWLFSTLAADVLLTGFILYGLSKAKTGWINTDTIINKLFKITLESQLPPTLIAIAFIISYARTIDDTVNGIFFVHGKVYTVCLLATLNSRWTMRMQASGSGNSSSGKKPQSFAMVEVYQQQTVEIDISPPYGERSSLDDLEASKDMHDGGSSDSEFIGKRV